MSTFSAPVFVGDVSNRATMGWVTTVQTAPVLFAATTALFTIPKPYVILEIYVDVTTAYTALATMAIGITGTLDKFADALDVDALGRVLASSDASQLPNWIDSTVAGGTEAIIATLTGAAAGASSVKIVYATPIAYNP